MKLGSITKYAVVFCVAFSIMLSATFIKSDEVNFPPYADVDVSAWYAEAVAELSDMDIIPKSKSLFYPAAPASRQDMVLYLYNLAMNGKTDKNSYPDVTFEDVKKDNTYYIPICWAYENGIVSGYSDTRFDPEGQCSREELCTMAVRYLQRFDVKVAKRGTSDAFWDSMKIGDFARSYVVAARLAGFVNGDQNGYFRPTDPITRAELAKIIYGMYLAITEPAGLGEETVDTSAGAYSHLYAEYKEYIRKNNHQPLVEWSPAVDASYFDDAVFVGDSVCMSLQLYCASTKALGNATFLCAGSLSPLNASWDVTKDSKHPLYKGQKMHVEDAVALCGAKKVYIMLGINSLAFGLDDCVNDMVKFIDSIIEKSPDAQIILQSVTPMTIDSPIMTDKLNNAVITEYNTRLYNIAKERGWYYVNVAEILSDEEGYLMKHLCSDPRDMGIHVKLEAGKLWVNYLKTHTPDLD